MGDDTPAALGALRVDEGKLKDHVDEVVRSSVEDTLNGRLEPIGRTSGPAFGTRRREFNTSLVQRELRAWGRLWCDWQDSLSAAV